MMQFRDWTPQQIVEALYDADQELKTVADQYAWLKGQRDYWKDRLEYRLAKGTMDYKGDAVSVKAKPFALKSVVENIETHIEIPWGEGGFVSLVDIVRLSEASFDLISKRYSRLETHIMILQSVNKNIMQDYGRSNMRESYA